MSKWKVWRHPLSGKWIVNDPDRRLVQAPGNTWREAMDYADRMARTVEVVLPRIAGCGDRVPGAPGIRLGWEYMAMDRDALAFWVEDEGSDVIHVQLDELRPLALALLALAEREEQQ